MALDLQCSEALKLSATALDEVEYMIGQCNYAPTKLGVHLIYMDS